MKQLLALVIAWSMLSTAQTPHLGLNKPAITSKDSANKANQESKMIDEFVAVKPATRDGVQYVSPRGKDTSDGLSWGTAKLTVDAALMALPGGSTSVPLTAGRGAVYIAGQVHANSDTTCGIWLMGTTDPGYSSPPACWMRSSGPLLIACGGPHTAGFSGHVPECDIIGGKWQDNVHPGLWLSNNTSITLRGLAFNANAVGVMIAICSNGDRNGTCGGGNVFFDGSSTGVLDVANAGPAVDIGSNALWVYFRDFSISAGQMQSPADDKAAAVNIDPGAGAGVGFVYFEDGFFINGGLQVHAGRTGSTIGVNNLSTEGDVQAAVWVKSIGGPLNALLNSVVMADCNRAKAGCHAVENDNANTTPDTLVVSGANNGTATDSLVGPMANLGGGQTPVKVASPLTQQQVGFFGGRVVAQQDSARRAFGPVGVRFANLARLPTSMTGVTTGLTAPDGTSGAVKLASASVIDLYNSGSITPTVGDWYIAGSWVRAASASGYQNGSPLRITINNSTFTGKNVSIGTSQCSPAWVPTREWQWVWCIAKVATVSGKGTLEFQTAQSASNPTSYYGPTLIKIASGTVSDSEAWEIAQNLQSYSSACSIGMICGLSGQTLHEDAFNVKLSRPSSSSDTCSAGTIWADAHFVYVCTATNTIKRVALTAF